MDKNRFPAFGTPLYNRPRINYQPPVTNVQEVHELPLRLPMGDLQSNSIRNTEDGFTVEYRNGDFSSELTIFGERFKVDEKYRTARMNYYIGTTKVLLGPRLAQLRMGPSEEADELIGKDLENSSNIHFISSKHANGRITGCFPDGYTMATVIPLGLSRETLHKLAAFFRNLPDNGSLSMRGNMVYAPHTVHYRHGLCPDVPQMPAELYAWTLNRGYLPIGMSVDSDDKGEVETTVHRAGFNLVLELFMKDLFILKEHLKQAGLITDRDESNPEEVAVVMYNSALQFNQECCFVSHDKSRRVSFPYFINDLQELSSNPLSHEQFEGRLLQVGNEYLETVRELSSRISIHSSCQ